ncbi:mucin-2-like [Macrobrachium nipponense]|uniref:mucin-2-like n=1 Tax=Macrobrachium nipponense TaxID=159736 RepID=UPI0030C84913
MTSLASVNAATNAVHLPPIIGDYSLGYLLRSSTEFLEEIRDSPGTGTIASLDVESLFTNVPVDETINIIMDRIYRDPSTPQLNIPEDTHKELDRVTQMFVLKTGIRIDLLIKKSEQRWTGGTARQPAANGIASRRDTTPREALPQPRRSARLNFADPFIDENVLKKTSFNQWRERIAQTGQWKTQLALLSLDCSDTEDDLSQDNGGFTLTKEDLANERPEPPDHHQNVATATQTTPTTHIIPSTPTTTKPTHTTTTPTTNITPQQPTEYNPPPLQQQQTTATQHQDPRYRQQKPPTNQRRNPPTQQPQQDQQQNTYHRDPRQTQNQDTNNTPTPASNPMSFYSTSTRKTPLLPTPPNHMNTPPTPNYTRDGSTSAESQHNTVEQTPEKGQLSHQDDDDDDDDDDDMMMMMMMR